jgi:hypothetical protein
MRKGKDPDPGGPKTCGPSGFGSPTLDFPALSVANLNKSAKFNSDAEQNYVKFLMTNSARFRYYKKNSETFLPNCYSNKARKSFVLTNIAIFLFFTVSRLFDEPYKILTKMKN